MSTHTSGPWEYGVRPDKTIWLSIGDPRDGAHYQGDLVASAADARLITAAPELYAALKALADSLPSAEYMAAQGKEEGPLLKEMRAALAKAEGKS